VKKLFFLAGALFLIAGSVTLLRGERSGTSQWVELSGKLYEVEVARTRDQLEQGLMFRKQMPAQQGMLFLFPQEMDLGFWMKNTLIPLDILYFDRQGVLVDQKRSAPPCRQDPCPTYPSKAPAQYVLELNAGQAALMGLKEGERIIFSPNLLAR
jgi:uncharacterized membrane protein (UPF0127 family)